MEAIESFKNTTRLRELNPDNIHELMDNEHELSLLSTRVFIDSIVFTKEDNRYNIYAANDKITLAINDNKVIPKVKGIAITGVKKTAIIKRMIKHSKLFDTSTSGEWSIYTFEYNNRLLQAGFRLTEHNAIVSFLSIYKPRDNQPTKEDYYRKWEEQNNRHHQSIDQNKPYEQGDSQYSLNDNITAFGIENTLNTVQEYLEYISAYKDIPEVKEMVEIYLEDFSTFIEEL